MRLGQLGIGFVWIIICQGSALAEDQQQTGESIYRPQASTLSEEQCRRFTPEPKDEQERREWIPILSDLGTDATDWLATKGCKVPQWMTEIIKDLEQ